MEGSGIESLRARFVQNLLDGGVVQGVADVRYAGDYNVHLALPAEVSVLLREKVVEVGGHLTLAGASWSQDLMILRFVARAEKGVPPLPARTVGEVVSPPAVNIAATLSILQAKIEQQQREMDGLYKQLAGQRETLSAHHAAVDLLCRLGRLSREHYEQALVTARSLRCLPEDAAAQESDARPC